MKRADCAGVDQGGLGEDTEVRFVRAEVGGGRQTGDDTEVRLLVLTFCSSLLVHLK